MDADILFQMILAEAKGDRDLARGIVEQLIRGEEITILTELYGRLMAYPEYPGYDIVVDKEEIEELIKSYLDTTV